MSQHDQVPIRELASPEIDRRDFMQAVAVGTAATVLGTAALGLLTSDREGRMHEVERGGQHPRFDLPGFASGLLGLPLEKILELSGSEAGLIELVLGLKQDYLLEATPHAIAQRGSAATEGEAVSYQQSAVSQKAIHIKRAS